MSTNKVLNLQYISEVFREKGGEAALQALADSLGVPVASKPYQDGRARRGLPFGENDVSFVFERSSGWLLTENSMDAVGADGEEAATKYLQEQFFKAGAGLPLKEIRVKTPAGETTFTTYGAFRME